MDHETYGTKVNEELENKPIYLFSFASNYKNRVWRNEVLMRKQERGIEERIASGFYPPLLRLGAELSFLFTGTSLPLVNNRSNKG